MRLINSAFQELRMNHGFGQLIPAFIPPTTCVAEGEYVQACKYRLNFTDAELDNDFYADVEMAFDTCYGTL